MLQLDLVAFLLRAAERLTARPRVDAESEPMRIGKVPSQAGKPLAERAAMHAVRTGVGSRAGARTVIK